MDIPRKYEIFPQNRVTKIMDAARPMRGGNDVMPRVSHTEAAPANLVPCFNFLF